MHSRFKGELGRRLALLVANLTGAAAGGEAAARDGPHATVSQNADGSFSLLWDVAVTVNGTQDCREC